MIDPRFDPFPHLKTERCVLRALSKNDAPAILEMRSNQEVLAYLDRDIMNSLNEAEEFIDKLNTEQASNNSITWGICFKDKHDLVGTICFWNILKEHHRSEIGYQLLPEFWNKGIMNEVIHQVIAFGFDKLKFHSIEANVNPQNQASIKLLIKNNFIMEGYLRENYLFRGQFLDSAIYSLLSDHAGFPEAISK